MSIIISWIVFAVAIGISAYVLPGVHVDSVTAALLAALVLGLINAFIRPIAILLTLPVNILTLGLFTLVINAVLILLASHLVSGFRVDSFTWALGFSLVLAVVSAILTTVMPGNKEQQPTNS
jgi:putative membrane protein